MSIVEKGNQTRKELIIILDQLGKDRGALKGVKFATWLVKSKRARVVKRHPFVIQLIYPDDYQSPLTNQTQLKGRAFVEKELKRMSRYVAKTKTEKQTKATS